MMRCRLAVKSLVIFIILSLSGCDKVSAMKITEPEYYLKLDMVACAHVVLVNGFHMAQDFQGYGNTSTYPLNHLIRQGENTFDLVVGPQGYMEKNTSDQSRCRAEIRVKGTVDGGEVDFFVTDLQYTPDYTSPKDTLAAKSAKGGSFKFSGSSETLSDTTGKDTVVSDVQVRANRKTGNESGGHSLYRSFTAHVPFPEWAFFSAERIFEYPMTEEKYDAMEAQIWPELMVLWDLFENKKIDEILPLFELRSKEIDQAFYMEEGETLGGIKSGLQRIYKQDLPLNRKSIDVMQMVVEYNEKLVKIVNAGTGNGSIMFYDKESDSNTFYDVSWMKVDGKWVIGR